MTKVDREVVGPGAVPYRVPTERREPEFGVPVEWGIYPIGLQPSLQKVVRPQKSTLTYPNHLLRS